MADTPGRSPDGSQLPQFSAPNALRHGLTSRVVVLPGEDPFACKKVSDEFLASLAPETFPETQCAQTIIDTQWRLNRVRPLEEGMLAWGHNSPTGRAVNRSGHPEIHGALTQAAVFLEQISPQRIAARQAALDEAVALHNLNKMLGLLDT
jgi:hypothetical protein